MGEPLVLTDPEPRRPADHDPLLVSAIEAACINMGGCLRGHGKRPDDLVVELRNAGHEPQYAVWAVWILVSEGAFIPHFRPTIEVREELGERFRFDEFEECFRDIYGRTVKAPYKPYEPEGPAPWLSVYLEPDYAELDRRRLAPKGDEKRVIQEPSGAAQPINSEVRETVTLLQMGAIVNRSKRTMEGYKSKGRLPKPCVRGGGGKPDEWYWDEVRPCLEKLFSRELPERFPAHQFVAR